MVDRIVADLHTHLNEKNIRPKAWWRGVERAGLDVVAITEHVWIDPKSAYEKLAATQPEESGVTLVAGMEMRTEFGDVIALSDSAEIYELPHLQQKGVKMTTAIKVARENDVVLSIAHPWGFDHDSFAYLAGLDKLRHYTQAFDIGTEAYNGLIGELAESVLKSGWVKRPMNFFGYMERNRIARKTGVGQAFEKLRKKADFKAYDLVMRSVRASEFADQAKFITAGSDAHHPDRLGCGVLVMEDAKRGISPRGFLDKLVQKEGVVWAGPWVQQKGNEILKKKMGVKKMEALVGLKYVAKSRMGRGNNKGENKKRKKG